MANFSIVIVPTKKTIKWQASDKDSSCTSFENQIYIYAVYFRICYSVKNGRVVRHENATNMNACLRKLINEYEEIVTSISYLPAISCTELIHIIAYEQKKKESLFKLLRRNIWIS